MIDDKLEPVYVLGLRSERIRQRARMTIFVMIIFSILVMTAIWLFQYGPRFPELYDYLWMSLVAGALSFGFWRGWQQFIARGNAWRLTVGSDFLLLGRLNIPDLRVDLASITKIVEIPGHSITVFTTSSKLPISIPSSVDHFEEVRSRLCTFSTGISEVRSAGAMRLAVVAIVLASSVFGVAGMLIVFTSDSPKLVVPVGLALAVLIVGTVGAAQFNPNIDSKTAPVDVALCVSALYDCHEGCASISRISPLND